VPDRATLRVLLVDDDEAMCQLVEATMRQNGFQAPTCVRTGHEALALVDDYDVVLLDHRLPDASGVELLPAFRARPHRPAVVVVTAYGNESLAATALRRGAEDYLIKDASLPALLPEVLERVRRVRALREALAAAERDFIHAERLAAIGQMNVTLHHNLNNPLMTAMAEAALLLELGDNLTTQQRESISAIKASLERIRDILHRVSTLRHDTTEQYLDGVSMIDLSRRTLPSAVQRGTALLWVPEEDIARVLGLLLKHAGFSVERVKTVGELSQAATQEEVRLVILEGAPTGGGIDPLNGFRPGEERGYTLVALVAGDGTAARTGGADLVVGLPFDPGTFTADVLAEMSG
jgi:DNA-binding response OmpR family regulator